MTERRMFSLVELGARAVPAVLTDADGSQWKIIGREGEGTLIAERSSQVRPMVTMTHKDGRVEISVSSDEPLLALEAMKAAVLVWNWDDFPPKPTDMPIMPADAFDRKGACSASPAQKESCQKGGVFDWLGGI